MDFKTKLFDLLKQYTYPVIMQTKLEWILILLIETVVIFEMLEDKLDRLFALQE